MLKALGFQARPSGDHFPSTGLEAHRTVPLFSETEENVSELFTSPDPLVIK
jgi:hypothetical protein